MLPPNPSVINQLFCCIQWGWTKPALWAADLLSCVVPLANFSTVQCPESCLSQRPGIESCPVEPICGLHHLPPPPVLLQPPLSSSFLSFPPSSLSVQNSPTTMYRYLSVQSPALHPLSRSWNRSIYVTLWACITPSHLLLLLRSVLSPPSPLRPSHPPSLCPLVNVLATLIIASLVFAGILLSWFLPDVAQNVGGFLWSSIAILCSDPESSVSWSHSLSHIIQLSGVRLQEDCGSTPIPPTTHMSSLSPSYHVVDGSIPISPWPNPCTLSAFLIFSLSPSPLLHYSPHTLSGETSTVLYFAMTLKAACIRFIFKWCEDGMFSLHYTHIVSGRSMVHD